MSAKPDGILLATSIPPQLVRDEAGEPVGQAYQELCLQSWQECGFRILSVNDRSEIADLAARFPTVEFLATDRNAAAISGRKNPIIADLLVALSRAPESVVGIANSDIVFEPTPAWGNLRSLVASKSVITGQRYDTRSLAYGSLVRYVVGFDYFFFGREAADGLIAEAQAFAMGLPWWDYWLPLRLAFGGHRIVHLERPAAIHLAHQSSDAYGAHSPAWRGLALAFAGALAAKKPDTGLRSSAQAESIHTHCAELIGLAADAAVGEDELDRRLIEVAGMAVRAIWDESMEFASPEAVSQTAAGTPFRHFRDRVAAGTALREATEREQRGEIREAEPFYQSALAKAPDDPGVLFACADFLGRTGRVFYAAELLRKATTRAPRASALWSSLGSALIELNRGDEGVRYLEKAVEIDPRSGPAYYDLARALMHLHRPEEEILRLQRSLLDVPDFPEAKEWAERIRQDFTPSVAPGDPSRR